MSDSRGVEVSEVELWGLCPLLTRRVGRSKWPGMRGVGSMEGHGQLPAMDHSAEMTQLEALLGPALLQEG